ncbi:MAG: hypothetical protein WA004_06755 [Saprospiraceae bacterium]
MERSPSFSAPEYVEAIAANPIPVLRNLQITQSYHQITVDFRELVDRDNLCWCGFATWASKQAGKFIRNEQVPEAFLELLGMDAGGRPSPRPWYWFLVPQRILRHPRVLAYARMTVADTSDHIARGNLKVYAKLARIFADFLQMVREQPGPSEERLAAFIEKMHEDDSTGEGLVNAFTYYYRCLSEPDPKVRAELFFAANLLIGQHEQIRLQEAIEGAMKSPIRQALGDPERRWTNLPLPYWLRQLVAFKVEVLLGPAITRLEKRWLQASTEMLMTMATPLGLFRLGQDVPPLPNGQMYPEILRELTLPEATALVAQFDYTPGTLSGSGANDWTSLAERLNFILDLFRSRQREEDLFEPPFSAGQTEAIVSGRVPAGDL